MGSACPQAVAQCRRRRSLSSNGGLFDLAEHAPRITAAEAAPITFAGDPTVTWVAVVDDDDRPVSLIDRCHVHPALRVLPAERLTDVARRVASRPAGERYAPVALCDERARLVGLVTVERILGRLADSLDAARATT
jgi:CBS domain-containing protein